MTIAALRAAAHRLSPLTKAEWGLAEPLFKERHVSAGEPLLRAGMPADHVYFVSHGLLREYYMDAAGREFTRQFQAPGDFSGSLADLLSGQPAQVSIEALADGIVLEADWARLDALAEQHLPLMKLMRRMAEHLYVRKMRREFEMLTLPAAERYQRFRQQYPDLDARLLRRHVASYLGITPVHLGRIRARR